MISMNVPSAFKSIHRDGSGGWDNDGTPALSLNPSEAISNPSKQVLPATSISGLVIRGAAYKRHAAGQPATELDHGTFHNALGINAQVINH